MSGDKVDIEYFSIMLEIMKNKRQMRNHDEKTYKILKLN
jgi:hypothetical protein